MLENKANPRMPQLQQAIDAPADRKDFDWTLISFVQMPFAMMLGGLNALGEDSHASYCSRYTLSARESFFRAFPYFEVGEKLDAYTQIYLAVGYMDNIGYSCNNAYTSELDASWRSQYTGADSNIGKTIGINLLYNAGYMWNDIVNY